MKNIKISAIGAGGSFFMGMIHDLCVTPGMHGCTISLMDINQERLNIAHALSVRYARERGVKLYIEKTTDRRASLKDADFVITTALIDGPRRLEEGWRTALKLGYRWPGSYHILYDEPFWLNFYQLRLFESITRDILELCPKAWHLLVSNPVIAATTFLQRKYPESKMVGLCHGFIAAQHIHGVIGLEGKNLTCECPGVNHFVWLTHCALDGKDVFPRLEDWLKNEAAARWGDAEVIMGPTSPKSMDLYRQLGGVPIGDTANWTGASWPWWYHTDSKLEKSWRVQSEQPWFRYVKEIGDSTRHRKILENNSESAAAQLKLGDSQTGELMVPIIESVSRDIPRVLIVNMLNRHEYIEGIPRDFEVEIPALVSRRGIQGIRTNGLPKAIIAHILRDRVAPVEMELAAYEKGSRALLRQLILMDKWTQSVKHADDLIDAIFALPYHSELREHYR